MLIFVAVGDTTNPPQKYSLYQRVAEKHKNSTNIFRLTSRVYATIDAGIILARSAIPCVNCG